MSFSYRFALQLALSLSLVILAACSPPTSEIVLEALANHNVLPADPSTISVLIESGSGANTPRIALATYQDVGDSGEEVICLAFLELSETSLLQRSNQIHEFDAFCYPAVNRVQGEFEYKWPHMWKTWQAVDGDTYTVVFGSSWSAGAYKIEALWQDQSVSSSFVTNGAYLLLNSGNVQLRQLTAYDSEGARLDQFSVPAAHRNDASPVDN